MAGNDKALTGAEVSLAVPSRRASLAGTVFLLAVAVFCLRQLVSFDVFWYLRAGDELLRRGVLLGTDPFSYTSTQPWVNHEWLAETAMALVYRAGGFAGLVGLQAVMVVAALALLLRQAWPHAGLEAWPAWLGLVCATATLGLSAEPRAGVALPGERARPGSLPQWTASISALAAAGFLLIRARRGEVIRFELIMLVVFGAAAIAYARFAWELSLISAASLLRAPRARPSPPSSARSGPGRGSAVAGGDLRGLFPTPGFHHRFTPNPEQSRPILE